MADSQTPQNYANHVHRPTGWAMTWLLSLVAVVWLAWDAVVHPSSQGFALVLLGGVVLAAVSFIRVFALRLQDRIIRLEMGVRLARLGLADRVGLLSLRQLVALRFASDVELPGLVDRTLSEGLDADRVKRAVTDWQADHLRT
jgi:Family of unknown function (DUF6526)